MAGQPLQGQKPVLWTELRRIGASASFEWTSRIGGFGNGATIRALRSVKRGSSKALREEEFEQLRR